jgi:hypothetical protein
VLNNWKIRPRRISSIHVRGPLTEEGPIPIEKAKSVKLSDGGGTLLTSAKVALIFWGKGWSGSAAPSMHSLAHALRKVLDFPYLSALAQYRRIGAPEIVGADLHDGSDPPNPFSDNDIVDMVAARIQSGKVPFNFDKEHFYGVFLLPGVVPQEQIDMQKDSPGALIFGKHMSVEMFGTWPFTPVAYCAYVTHHGGATVATSLMTETFTHEFVEACTDADGGSGILADVQDQRGNHQEEEICDLCQNDPGMIDGVPVSSYFSGRDGLCVAPQVYSVQWFFRLAKKNAAHGLRAALPIPLPGAPLSVIELLRLIV